MSGQHQVHVEGATMAETDTAWIRRILSDSIYLWACGENAEDDDDDPKLSDRLIGWLILFMQGFAYTMLIFLVRATSNSDNGSSADDSEESGHLLPSVTGAMYLLVASTTHDLRAGYSLLKDGSCAGHRAFGIGLLIVYGIMIAAAMTVLVSTSDDSASVVLNAVTVLFIADLDEKALKFLATVPQKWRLFWAIESIGFSFALALVAIFHIGDDSPLLEGKNGMLKTFPTWFVWGINPAAVTLSSVLVSSTLQAVCEWCSGAFDVADEPSLATMVARACGVVSATIKQAHQRFRREPCFHVALGMWLAQGVVSWFFMVERSNGFPIAVFFNPTTPESTQDSLMLTDSKLALLYINVILAIGLAMKAFGYFLPNIELHTAVPDFRHSSEGSGLRGWRGSCIDSRVPSLLVGWGVGYWSTSLLYVLCCSWHGGGCGWNNAPLFVTVIGYAVVSCFLAAGIFMVADINILGTRVGAFIHPAVDILRNRSRVEYWIMASVFRDILSLWVGFCESLRSELVYHI